MNWQVFHETLKPCSKCGAHSGDSWGQCEGKCPVVFSPHYDPTLPGAPHDFNYDEAYRKANL